MAGLDGLRGIAVLMVVLLHTTVLVRLGTGATYRRIVSGGWLGVDIFFVLSGFLITALLLAAHEQSGRTRFREFYARRGLRLMPALWTLLAVQAIATAVSGRWAGPERSTLVWALGYVSNWQNAWHLFSVNAELGHLWSLAIEEQFYLVWPVLLAGLLALKRPRAGAAVIAAGIALVAVHRIDVWNHSQYVIAPFVRTDTRADSLLVGCLLAWARHFRLVRVPPAVIARCAALGAIVCVAVAQTSGGPPTQAFWYCGGFTLFAVLVAIVISAVVDGQSPGRRQLEHPRLVLLGRVSYGVYLWHLPIFFEVARHTTTWWPVARIALALILTAAATVASWKLVERPAQRLRRRFATHTQPHGLPPLEPGAPTAPERVAA